MKIVLNERRNFFDIQTGTELEGDFKKSKLVKIHAQTEKAILFWAEYKTRCPKGTKPVGWFSEERRYKREMWIPRSQIKEIQLEKTMVYLIPEWIAKKDPVFHGMFTDKELAMDLLAKEQNNIN